MITFLTFLENKNFGLFYSHPNENPENKSIFDKTYQNYFQSMGKRRTGSELGYDSFSNYISSPDVICFGDDQDGYVFGQQGKFENVALFKPSHFSPNSQRAGYRLLNELNKQDEFLVLFAITSDLKSMLKSIGFYDLNIEFPMIFRDQFVQKHILCGGQIARDYKLRKILITNIQSLLNGEELKIIDPVHLDRGDEYKIKEKPRWRKYQKNKF
jgi:hypothetical protein